VSVRTRFPAVLLSACLSLLALSAPSAAPVRTVEGTVVRVFDGDTVSLVTREGTKLRIRLYGIDAPEVRHEKMPGQPFGKEAWDALEALVLGRRVTVRIVDVDAHKRLVGVVHLAGRDINLAMVRGGYAWAYRRYLPSPYASVYINAERKAREEKLGLWIQDKPEPPWEYKRQVHDPRQETGFEMGKGLPLLSK